MCHGMDRHMSMEGVKTVGEGVKWSGPVPIILVMWVMEDSGPPYGVCLRPSWTWGSSKRSMSPTDFICRIWQDTVSSRTTFQSSTLRRWQFSTATYHTYRLRRTKGTSRMWRAFSWSLTKNDGSSWGATLVHTAPSLLRSLLVIVQLPCRAALLVAGNFNANVAKL